MAPPPMPYHQMSPPQQYAPYQPQPMAFNHVPPVNHNQVGGGIALEMAAQKMTSFKELGMIK